MFETIKEDEYNLIVKVGNYIIQFYDCEQDGERISFDISKEKDYSKKNVRQGFLETHKDAPIIFINYGEQNAI